MKAIADRTTVVLAGAFNPAILLPQWVAQHGLGHPAGQEFQVEVLAPVGGAGQPRYTFDGLSYSVGFKAMLLHLDNADAAQCDRAVGALANILQRLPHTPVSGLGFNFGFSIEEPTAPLLGMLQTNDALVTSFPGEPPVVVRRWGNTLQYGEALVNVDGELAGEQVTIAFNFHYSVASAQAAEQILRIQGGFQEHRIRAIAAAQALSGQQLEA